MQGSYNNNGLPRPYYMKPSKRGSAYEKMPRQIFLTNSRKLTGYIVMLFLFGLCVFFITQELKEPVGTEYELVAPEGAGMGAGSAGKNLGDVGKLVDLKTGEEQANEKADLALNKVQNSKGEYGRAVLEAPKGGMVNEGPVVGTDEDMIIDGRKKTPGKNQYVASGGNTVKAARGNEKNVNQVAAGVKMTEAEAIKEDPATQKQKLDKQQQKLDQLNKPLEKATEENAKEEDTEKTLKEDADTAKILKDTEDA